MNKKFNLSDKQKEVVRLLQVGGVMFIPHSYFVDQRAKIVIRNGSDYKEVNKLTFKALFSRDIIYQYKYISSEHSIYKLTNTGKSLNF